MFTKMSALYVCRALILVQMASTTSCIAEPHEKPRCYSVFKEGSTCTTFKQTKCTDGAYAHRFESAKFILSELLTINFHDSFHGIDQTTNTVPSDADNIESTAPFINSPTTTTKINDGESTSSATTLIPASSSSAPTTDFLEATTTTEEYYSFQIISENNTYVRTPNFPSNYDNSMTLWFSIRPPDKLSRVSLTFTSFDLEWSPDCIPDRVLILGTLNPSPLCGNTIPSPVTSLGNILEIHFKSDSKTTSQGFEAIIEFLDPDPEYRTPAPGICESVNLQSNGSANLDSPSGGHRNIQCGYIIHADIGKVIVLSFRWIQLEVCVSRADNADFEPAMSAYDIPEVILGIEHEIDVATCLCDSLQIFDGFNAKAPNLTDRLCSYELPTITPTSTGNVMYVYLETDNEVRTGGFGINLNVK